MLSEDRFGMRPLWDALLGIYGEFAAICDKHNLRYYLLEGNAIGAVRHKGFVPWDDDIDVAMPRPDYERFISECLDDLPPNLKFLDWNNAPEFTLSFGKIQETRREIVEGIENRVGFQLSNGLYIDILVLDGCPKGGLALFVYKYKLFILEAMFRSKMRTFASESCRGKRIWLLGRVLSIALFWVSADCVKAWIETHMRSIPFEDAEMTWRAGGAVRVQWVFPRRIWNGVVMHEFDTINAPLPKGYDEYLRIQYGDYMKLPPPEKQVPSHSYAARCPWWLGPTKGSW